MKNLIFLLIFLSLIGCKENNEEEKIPVEPDNGIGNGAEPPKVLSFPENMEEAHNKNAFMMKEAVSFDIKLNFGGSTRLEGTVRMTTTSSKIRLDKTNGTSLIYDGTQIYSSPKSAPKENARFDIFTWQYFFALPFKLTDRGTVWEVEQEKRIDSTKYKTAKLSFESNIGDSPDDWYIIYAEPGTGRLKAAAYIVTFNKSKQKAEQDPHAIIYSNYQSFENIDIATQWSFHNWNLQSGFGEKIGEASISNIQFFSPTENVFKAPKSSEIINR